jgi:hypothetical protein
MLGDSGRLTAELEGWAACALAGIAAPTLATVAVLRKSLRSIAQLLTGRGLTLPVVLFDAA